MNPDLRNIIRKIILENSESFSIEPIQQEDIPAVIEICGKALSNVDSPQGISSYLRSAVDWNISKKAVLNGEIIGCYLFNESPIYHKKSQSGEDLSKYKNLKGLQGVALAIDPKFKGSGYGKKLRDVPFSMGYDYIWGLHLKRLKNIDDWTKFGRRIIYDSGSMYTTLMDLKDNSSNNINENFDKFHKFQEDGYTCGPTCVKMVSDYSGINDKKIEDIIELCSCTPTSGTIDTGIKNALNSLGLKNEQNPYMGDEAESILFLNKVIDEGNVFIMRTLTKGIKHWIVIYGKSDKYLVADPWLGLIKYDLKQILSIWKPRNFDGFVVYK